MYLPLAAFRKATELTRRGRLLEATRTLGRALARSAAASAKAGQQTARERPASQADAPGSPDLPGTCTTESFRFGGTAHPYRLYLPPSGGDGLLPVLVLLHGCTQDAADFAAGTAMDTLAAERGCIVVYPEQRPRANSMRCWNWFEPAHQQRGHGEPAMIAALARQVAQQHGGDPQRVYVAGLSAGGAMAALLGQLYPDVFAAVGVHSGLPPEAASDVRSAFAAMRRGVRRPQAAQDAPALVPTIVFHGRADRTVHPDNGRHVIAEALARADAAGVVLQREEQRIARRSPLAQRAARRVPRRATAPPAGALGHRRPAPRLVGRARRRLAHRPRRPRRLGGPAGVLPAAPASVRMRRRPTRVAAAGGARGGARTGTLAPAP